MLSPGVETWSKILLKVGFARKEEFFSDFQDQTTQTMASGPGPDGRVSGVWPPGLRKTPFAPTQSPVGFTPWPNHIILYINLYLRTILELLVMSVISSRTSDNVWSPTYITHIELYLQRTLSVRTLRVRELCRHDRGAYLVNNQ